MTLIIINIDIYLINQKLNSKLIYLFASGLSCECLSSYHRQTRLGQQSIMFKANIETNGNNNSGECCRQQSPLLDYFKRIPNGNFVAQSKVQCNHIGAVISTSIIYRTKHSNVILYVMLKQNLNINTSIYIAIIVTYTMQVGIWSEINIKIILI